MRRSFSSAWVAKSARSARVVLRGRPPDFPRRSPRRGIIPARRPAWCAHRTGHRPRVPAPGESAPPHIFCLPGYLQGCKYSGSVVRSSSWPQRRRRSRISAMQDCSSRLPTRTCVTLAPSPNLETALASLPTALPSNPRRLPLALALLFPGIRDGCAMLFAFVVIRDIALRRSWT